MRKPKRPIMAAIHETAEDLNAAGLMDQRTMRQFDKMCLTPELHAKFKAALAAPPADNPGLRALLARKPAWER